MGPFLTIDQQDLVDALTRHCRERIAPVVQPYAGEPAVPREVLQPLLKGMLEFGLGNGRIAEEDGGLGLDSVTAGLVLETGVHWAIDVAGAAFINETVALILSRYASPLLKERYLAPLIVGDTIGATANTEPSGGSDVASVATRAEPTATGYRIRGRKVWITNAQYADFVVVLARSTETGQLDLYVVDREEHGYDVTPLVTNGSISTAELAFDVEIPADHRLDTGGKGLGAMLGTFQEARAFVAITAIGMALGAQDAALAYAEERPLFGGPIAGKQLVQAKLAESHVEIEAARGLAFGALARKDMGKSFDLQASMAKLFATEMAQRVVDRSMQILGGYGTTPEYPVEKLYRLVAMSRIYEGPSDIQRLVIGKALTGRSAF